MTEELCCCGPPALRRPCPRIQPRPRPRLCSLSLPFTVVALTLAVIRPRPRRMGGRRGDPAGTLDNPGMQGGTVTVAGGLGCSSRDG